MLPISAPVFGILDRVPYHGRLVDYAPIRLNRDGGVTSLEDAAGRIHGDFWLWHSAACRRPRLFEPRQ